MKEQKGSGLSLYCYCASTSGIMCSVLSTCLAANTDKVEKVQRKAVYNQRPEGTELRKKMKGVNCAKAG